MGWGLAQVAAMAVIEVIGMEEAAGAVQPACWVACWVALRTGGCCVAEKPAGFRQVGCRSARTGVQRGNRQAWLVSRATVVH